jgi:hypothetical protein
LETRNTYNTSVEKNKRSFERPWRRWKNNIKMCLTEKEYRVWMDSSGSG